MQKDNLKLWDVTDFYDDVIKDTPMEEQELFLRIRLECMDPREKSFLQQLFYEFYFGAPDMKNEIINKNVFPLTMQFQIRFPTFQITRVFYDKGCDNYDSFRFPSLFIGFIPQDYDGKITSFADAVKTLDYLYFVGTKKMVKKCFLSYTKSYMEKLIDNSEDNHSKVTVKCKLQQNIFSEITGLSEQEILYDDCYPDIDDKCYMLMQLEKEEEALINRLSGNPGYKLTEEDRKILMQTEELLH